MLILVIIITVAVSVIGTILALSYLADHSAPPLPRQTHEIDALRIRAEQDLNELSKEYTARVAEQEESFPNSPVQEAPNNAKSEPSEQSSIPKDTHFSSHEGMRLVASVIGNRLSQAYIDRTSKQDEQ